jgi:endonuclease YncB( thermonuclease family)
MAVWLLLTCLLLAGTPPTKFPIVISGKVVAIKDGDTFEVMHNGKAQTVRLYGIDCPEKSQPFGKAAKQYASQWCFGKTVTVYCQQKRDRYQRYIGKVYVGQQSVNEAMLQAGYAWHFKQYSKDANYAQLEKQAKANKKGLWSVPGAIPPWEWRKK